MSRLESQVVLLLLLLPLVMVVGNEGRKGQDVNGYGHCIQKCSQIITTFQRSLAQPQTTCFDLQLGVQTAASRGLQLLFADRPRLAEKKAAQHELAEGGVGQPGKAIAPCSNH